ncbi:MerR family transcriptional regulator [Promicromonospora sp. NPDC060204]|uniref:MerR family transcriptional regulator n=1 Tax=Promicromonospora sp. NPDC060204 TaxID=3347071 RepID=UPI00364C579B
MAWSTRELAELAGTTVKSVRFYHERGLLEEPDRLPNGYKQYEVRHLVSLLRIRRLTELGVPLADIDTVRAGDTGASAALRELDAELASSIERQVEARSAIAAILDNGGPADVPRGFEAVAPRLSHADSSLVHVYGQLYSQAAMIDVRRMVEDEPAGGADEFDSLPDDADEATRQRIAAQLAPYIVRQLRRYPRLTESGEHLSKGELVARQTLSEALAELYNSAQIDVLMRAGRAAQAQPGPEGNVRTRPRPGPTGSLTLP